MRFWNKYSLLAYMHCAMQPPTRVELFRDKLIVTGPIRCSTSLLSLYSKFSRDCNLELYQISWSSSMSSRCCIGVAAWSGIEAWPQFSVTSVGVILNQWRVKPLQPPANRTLNTWTPWNPWCMYTPTPHSLPSKATLLGGWSGPLDPGQRRACLEWKRKSEGVMDDERENNRPCASIRLFYLIF